MSRSSQKQPVAARDRGAEWSRGGRNRHFSVSLAGFVIPLFLLAAAFALVLWSVSFREVVIDSDEALYAVVARSWAQGSLLYRDIFDHKPPVIYVLYRGVFAMFGESLTALRVVFALLTSAIGVGAALVVRAVAPSAPRFVLVATALATVYAYGSATTQGPTANCEVPMMFFVTAAALAALGYRRERDRHWLALYGLAGTLAVLTKPVCTLEIAIFLVVVLTGAREPAQPRDLAVGVGAAAAGAALPVLAVGLYFAAHGALADAFEGIIGYNARYAAVSPVPFWSRTLNLAWWGGVGFLPLVAGILLLAWQMRRGRNRFAGTFLMIWTAAAMAGVLSAGRQYPHYLGQLGVPLACAAAVAVASLEETSRRARWRVRLTWLVVAVILLLPSLRNTLYEYRLYASWNNWGKDLGEQLARQLRPEDSVLVWGANPEIYWFANRRPATRFIFTFRVFGDSPFAERARREFSERTVAARPGAIIVPRNDRSAEDRRTSDEEWKSFWVPAFGSFLQDYTSRETPLYTIYLRR